MFIGEPGGSNRSPGLLLEEIRYAGFHAKELGKNTVRSSPTWALNTAGVTLNR